MAATPVKYTTVSLKWVSHSFWASVSVFSFVLLTQMSKGNAALAPEEESVLELLAQRFDQLEWTGDPCDSGLITCSNNSQISHVEMMNLKKRNLTGPIPTEISKLRRMQDLALSTNMFTGPIPDLSNMTNLTNLDLSDNRLSGGILNTSAFTKISNIDLSKNDLSGGIPESLFQHPSATVIKLESNPLGGPIPDMSELRNLTKLSLHETGISGRIPESISNLTRLREAGLRGNPNLTGVLPDLSRLQLEYFDVQNCNLSGPLPGLESSSGLEGVYLTGNDFSGRIPPALFQHPKLQWLLLGNNPRLSGAIPDVSQIYDVEKFELNGCNFSGPLPLLEFNTKLRFLQVADNRLTSMPSDLRHLTKLATVDVSNNRMAGNLPDLPARSTQGQEPSYFLTDIDFTNNNFSGGIPDSWTELTSLETMLVGNNRLSGQLAAGLGNLTSLQELNVSNNHFTGPIPEDFGRLEELTTLDLTNNQFNGTVPQTLAGLSKLTTLRLDNNSFTGIPEVLLQRGRRGLLNITFGGNPNLIIPRTNNGSSSDLSLGAIIGIVIGAVSAVMTLLVVAIHMINRRNGKHDDQLCREDMPKSAQAFTLNQIKAITASNKTLIGKGGFGPVYHGKLPDGKEVAVKVRAPDSNQGAQEFLNEVRLLSKLHHRNLVPLVGYCLEGHEQILVYQYMSQGTLQEHLYSTGSNDPNRLFAESTGHATYQPLDWKTRLDIALNTGKGLQYLHKDCNPPVIHRDVKSSNILLTEKLYARVADLGISKQAPDPDTEEALNTGGVSTAVKGSLGYLDPEYFARRKLTTKSDVYSFGVVLLEIITGRRPQSQKFPNSNETNLIGWVRGAVNNNQIKSVVDPALEGKYNEDGVVKVARTALSCVSLTGVERPDMCDIINILMEALQMEFEELLDETSKSATEVSVPFSDPRETHNTSWTPVNTTVSDGAYSHSSWNTDPR